MNWNCVNQLKYFLHQNQLNEEYNFLFLLLLAVGIKDVSHIFIFYFFYRPFILGPQKIRTIYL